MKLLSSLKSVIRPRQSKQQLSQMSTEQVVFDSPEEERRWNWVRTMSLAVVPVAYQTFHLQAKQHNEFIPPVV
jgi:hypothetical protein